MRSMTGCADIGRKMAERKIIYETENFILYTHGSPHIPREDGGHICITAKVPVNDRTEFSPAMAKEFVRLSMMAGEAFVKGMALGGVNIARINYQENGNWAFRKQKPYKPFFHLHLYGRTEDSKTQEWGEALNFPDPDTGFYDGMTPLTDDDIANIAKCMDILSKTDRYDPKNW